MRPILKLLPAFIWLWIIKRHAERVTLYGPTVAHDVGVQIGCRHADAPTVAAYLRGAADIIAPKN